MDIKTSYTPSPVDTSDVVLPESLTPYLEALAENVHETWAKGRVDAGWKYGEIRDEGKKIHPCLIPYHDLPEAEKDYDRATAVSTLKLICKMGYCIEKE